MNDLEQVMKEYNESLKGLRDAILRLENNQSFMAKQIDNIYTTIRKMPPIIER